MMKALHLKHWEMQVHRECHTPEATCVVTVTGGTAVALSVICLPFVLPAVRRVCLPYVPATATQIRNVMHALAGRTGRLVDLGSGDGRIVS
jgi:hypothetical protein